MTPQYPSDVADFCDTALCDKFGERSCVLIHFVLLGGGGDPVHLWPKRRGELTSFRVPFNFHAAWCDNQSNVEA